MSRVSSDRSRYMRACGESGRRCQGGRRSRMGRRGGERGRIYLSVGRQGSALEGLGGRLGPRMQGGGDPWMESALTEGTEEESAQAMMSII